MAQEERWHTQWKEIIDFMETSHRNPSRHCVEEHLMFNGIKQNQKLMNAGKLKLEKD